LKSETGPGADRVSRDLGDAREVRHPPQSGWLDEKSDTPRRAGGLMRSQTPPAERVA
jgi:hypothetical protein